MGDGKERGVAREEAKCREFENLKLVGWTFALKLINYTGSKRKREGWRETKCRLPVISTNNLN